MHIEGVLTVPYPREVGMASSDPEDELSLPKPLPKGNAVEPKTLCRALYADHG